MISLISSRAFGCYSFLLIATSSATRLSAQTGLDQAQPFAPFLNGVFPSHTPGSTPGGSWATQNAFGNLTFPEPVRIVEHPRDTKLAVVSKTGTLWIFNDSPLTSTKQVLLDLTGKTNFPTVGEGGVTGLAFHPDFGLPASPNRGFIYVAYRFTPGMSGAQSSEQAGFNRISRFTVPDGASTATLDSELVMIHQYDRQQWHIGGDMFFGNDGFLHIAVGDEGNSWSRTDATQRVNGGLWSGILRIDVNNDPTRSAPITRQPKEPAVINSAADSQLNARPASWPASFTQGYSIPLDNPFRDTTFDPAQTGEAKSLGEFYAIGLRHPWTISHDRATGFIWYADVGESQREEIGRIDKGSNHQWGFKEGLDTAGPIPQPSPLIGISTPPVLDYSGNVGKAVIGAGVYRGPLFPELQGKYLFSDFVNGQFWAIDAGQSSPIAMRSQTTLPTGVQFLTQLPAGFGAGINAHLITRDGRILMAKSAGGSKSGGLILKLVRQGTPTAQPPALLSQTGAFQNLAALSPSPGFIPYSMVVPFWSDHSVKSRWFAIPNDGSHDTAAEKIPVNDEGDWDLPVGSVAIKHFEIALDRRNPSLTKRLETRFLIHGNDGWYGVSYRWNPAGTDAELLFESELQNLQIIDATGKAAPQTWTYPSRTQCMTCHTTSAGGTLGLLNRQLNKEHFYPSTGRTANQLTTLSHLGILHPPVNQSDPSTLPTLKATHDPAATLADRARSYIDSNCAYCHHPEGVRANFDARFTTTLENSSLINGPLVESLGVSGASVVSPGSLTKSILHLRAASLGEGHSMPPLAKGTVDVAGVAVIADWIHSLAPANGNGSTTLGNPTSTGGNFSDAHHPSLLVNKSDSFTNNQASPLTISLATFHFYATKKGNPVTPFAAIVTGTDAFTIAAIGTTRPSSFYQTGQNQFLFSNSGAASFTLPPGATFVTGFMDCLPDGSGWGGGSVIPAVTTGGTAEDDVWALLPDPLVTQTTPFNPAVASPALALGQTILTTNAGKPLKVYPNLQRSYKFSVSFTPAIQAAAPDGHELIVNGSFEDTTPKPTTWLTIDKAAVAGWDSNAPTGLIEIWKSGFLDFPASDGFQLCEMDGNTLEQTFFTVPGSTLEWSFHHRGREGSDKVALELGNPDNPTRINTFTTGQTAWMKYQGSYVVPPGQTRTKFSLIPISGAFAITSANLVDQVSVIHNPPATPPEGGGGGTATPGLRNGSFEDDLEFWNHSNVAVVQNPVHAGSKALDLKSGFIEQTLTGLTPGLVHTFFLAYRSQPGVTGLLGDAVISIQGIPIGELHNASTGYIHQNGFEFTPAAATATLRIQSLETGTAGLLIDSLSVVRAAMPPPPSSPALVNGSFEDQSGLSGVNPHPAGFDLPGWLVTRENVDTIKVSAFTGWTAVDGDWVLDLGGHGPGGIAQTVTGLVPGSVHDLTFSYSRHRFWDQEPTLKAEVFANGSLVTTLERTLSQKVPLWTASSLPLTASAAGTLTIEFRSISKLVGGGIIIDNVRLTPREPSNPDDPSNPDPQAPFDWLVAPTLSGQPGNHLIGIHAPRAGTYILERSINLRDWQRVDQLDITAPRWIDFPAVRPAGDVNPQPDRLFYRIGLLFPSAD
jgi:uncharacterized repeat protein (TIGR03806 family)